MAGLTDKQRELLDAALQKHGIKRDVPDAAQPGPAASRPEATLSLREVEVLQLVAGGMRNKEIGELLHLSTETVKTHVKNILGKLDTHTRTHAVALGYQLGYLDIA